MRNTFLSVALLLLLLPVAALALPSFSGALVTPTGVIATDGWTHPNGGFKISWTISQMLGGEWFYQYALTNAAGAQLVKQPSHLIIEVSTDAVAADFWGREFEINTYSGANPSNPYMPGSLWAIKVDAPNGTPGTFEYSFYSDRAPTWGDFYSKDGQQAGVFATAYNTDFLLADPTAPPQNGILHDQSGAPIYKILRPDTEITIVPEPGTLMLLGLGLAGVGLVRRKR